MEVILLEKVKNLGNLGEKVNVRPGYGRNFLIPNGRALPATKANLAEFERRRIKLEQEETEKTSNAEQRKLKLDGMTVTVKRLAGEEGRLFGSVGTADIAAALTAAGVPVEKSEVRLPEGVLRAVGAYEVGIHLHSDVDVLVNVLVEAES